MKKYIILLSLSVISFLIKGQDEPIDTIFYENGDLLSIKYKKSGRYGYSAIRYFKNSFNILDKNRPIVDTIYNNNFANKKDWTHYNGSTRILLHDESYVWISKTTKYGNNKDSVFNLIRGGYEFLFRDLDDLQITIGYTKDTMILSLCIDIHDSIRQGNSFREHFYRSYYQNGAKFESGEGYHLYECGQHGTLELEFSTNNLLQKIYFYPKDKDKHATYYEFYDNFFCAKHGFLQGRLPVGEWHEYHTNGNIKSVGNYEIQEKNGVKESIKSGKWKCFREDGSIIKGNN